MYLMIDNYDSFVHNLVTYFQECGQEVTVVRNDKITPEAIHRLLAQNALDGIILSPGPKSPADCGICKEVIRQMAGKVPILGVCLGHQIIGHVFGAEVRKGVRPMHGKVTEISNNRKNLFARLPEKYLVTRYHSLTVSEREFPEELEIDARSEDGAVMAIHHRRYPIYGVQFHPEAVLTEYGHELIGNFVAICKEWRSANGNGGSEAGLL